MNAGKSDFAVEDYIYPLCSEFFVQHMRAGFSSGIHGNRRMISGREWATYTSPHVNSSMHAAKADRIQSTEYGRRRHSCLVGRT